MFGIDFPELVVIAVVALIVIGPEHLPRVARTMGHLWGRAQRYINNVKVDISRDMALDELRQLQQKTQQEISGVEQSMTQSAQEWEQQVREFERDATAPPQAMPGQAILGQDKPGDEMSRQEMPRNDMTRHEMPRHEMTDEQPAEPHTSPEQKNISKT